MSDHRTDETAVLAAELTAGHDDADAALYVSKVEAIRIELDECAADTAEAERNIAGWTSKLDAAGKRRARLTRQLKAARTAQRAMEDAVDGI